MKIKKIIVKNYKLLRDENISLNPGINIFVGDNDAGKSTILEALSILTTGKLNGNFLDRQLKANMFNRHARFEYINAIKENRRPEPPKIIFEAYFEGDAQYKGTQNSLSEDTSGINVTVEINQNNSASYKELLDRGEVKDIPVELYSVSCHYFSGEQVMFRNCPFKSVVVDAGRKEYIDIVNHFASGCVDDNLLPIDLTNLAVAYKKSRKVFQEDEAVKKLNESVKNSPTIQGKQISLEIREVNTDDWKRQLTMVVDSVHFEYLGFGTQNSIKIELALKNAGEQANVVLMEEPENNLSFANMSKLIGHVLKSEGKQVFIATHSSYIANKLDLSKVHLVREGEVFPFNDISDDTKKYFIKLPGYDTLRFILSEKTILVEGPTDDLIVQRAYRDENGKLPLDDGIDVFVVDSLAFKRFCEIAKLLGKKTVIVTDNDGDVQSNICKKYKDYLNDDNFTFFYESDENLKTIESCVLDANCENDIPSDSFKSVISVQGSMMNKSRDDILSFMLKHKTEWALRVFDADASDRINYPEYIKNVVKHFK